jgi:hypothetical protein
MKPAVLTFYANPEDDQSLVLDHDRFINTKTITYVGRKMADGGYPPTLQPYKVKTELCYIKPAQFGQLIPADKLTADYCRVKFDPSVVKKIEAYKNEPIKDKE